MALHFVNDSRHSVHRWPVLWLSENGAQRSYGLESRPNTKFLENTTHSIRNTFYVRNTRFLSQSLSVEVKNQSKYKITLSTQVKTNEKKKKTYTNSQPGVYMFLACSGNFGKSQWNIYTLQLEYLHLANFAPCAWLLGSM